jgi:hypothetical protein
VNYDPLLFLSCADDAFLAGQHFYKHREMSSDIAPLPFLLISAYQTKHT